MEIPTDRERQRLAAGERLLGRIKALEVENPMIAQQMGGAAHIEIWETESWSSEPRVTVMSFDASGTALRARIFETAKDAETWMEGYQPMSPC